MRNFGKSMESDRAQAIASQRRQAVANLEKKLSAEPEDPMSFGRLVAILDTFLPDGGEAGPYTECQRFLVSNFREETWLDDALNISKIPEYYKQWQGIVDSMCKVPSIAITQLFYGGIITINDEPAYCNKRLALFKEESVISRLCHECYKVQILTSDVAALMQVYFIFRKLELPRDNTRKCMVEIREDIPNPYKGYIYCQSEEEAFICLEKFQEALRAYQVSNVFCAVSHGCSEFGLEYPNFKFSADGAHHSFERPAVWDEVEDKFWSEQRKMISVRDDNYSESITLRDIIVLRTWIDYAEMIGDTSCGKFRDKPSTRKPKRFAERVEKQSRDRKMQLDDLRQRLSSSS